jgi:general secretion pathway protein K
VIFFNPLKNQKGSAILFSVFFMSLLMFIALEISKDTVVEYQGSLNTVKRVQAYYAAKACNELSLLRIKTYQQATRSLSGAQTPGQPQMIDTSMLDIIWQFPLSWPLVVPTDGDMSIANQEDIKKANNQSTFKHRFSSQISSEGGKIDVNDLASPSKVIREKTRLQILDIFQAKIREQGPFSKKYYNFRFEDLLNHMTDWIDADKNSLMGGDESSHYRDMQSQYIPPNQPFKTVDELHMVKMMEDQLYEVLAPNITVYGGKGINVNYADKTMLMALDPGITELVVTEILKRRSDINLGGPFKDEKDFFGFIGGFGVNTTNFNQDKVPLYFDPEINFRISCIGLVGNLTREITSIVFDFGKVQSRLRKSLTSVAIDQQCQDQTGEELYKCICRDKPVVGDEQKKCIDEQRALEKKNTDQGAGAPLPPGPPYVIFQDVK